MSRNLFALSLPLAAAAFFMTATMLPAYAKSPDAPKHEAGPQKGKVFGSWGIGCEGDGDKKKCFAAQTQMKPDSKDSLLQVYIGYIGPKGEAVMVVMLPLGISVQAGAAFKIDDAAQTALKIQQCVVEGCQATITLDDALLKAFRSGKKALFAMAPFSDQKPITVIVPLDGLDQAISSLK